MRKIFILFSFFFIVMSSVADNLRMNILLRDGWKFTREDDSVFAETDYNDRKWRDVSVPHDWAIEGPFGADNDRQFMAIEQDGQKEAREQAGRTGGLPFVGVGWYRLDFDVPEWKDGKRAFIMFDGAMSNASVFVNGRKVGTWPYGYNSFWFDITPFIESSDDNVLAVRLENMPESSRWYPGAGIYRNVHLVVTNEVAVKTWGTAVTTPVVKDEFAKVNVKTELTWPDCADAEDVTLQTVIINAAGEEVASGIHKMTEYDEKVAEQTLIVKNPSLWDCDNPYMYKAVSRVFYKGEPFDEYCTDFGIRTIEVVPDKGFFLNGKKLIFKGTCNHHDLGPLGTAVNESAIRYRLQMLKDMGSNAYRTSHNMPSPELVRACNEMGMLLMIESFDEWKKGKMANGYNRFFDGWIEKDLVNMVRHYRNDPSVVMWCIGNEVPDQTTADGSKICRMIQDIVHREDPTRPCTQGMDRVEGAIKSHVAAIMDVPGFNYRSHKYEMAYSQLPQRVLIGSETASTVSSRGVYKFPVQRRSMAMYDDHQSSSYDLEHCSWSDLPEDNFMRYEELPYDMGEFVWTGFDYLGEPTPYYSNWPSHSSLFGIIDLAYIPKDRYYLYRSVWNTEDETLHILPHWNWKGREGETTPVFVYTSYPTVELFINGKSQGRRTKDMSVRLADTENDEARKSLARQKKYRLMWMDTKYEPGVIKAVAYDANGVRKAECEVRTAGEPYRLVLECAKKKLDSSLRDEDLAFVTVSVEDKDGNPCPTDNRAVSFKVKGNGFYKAGANGDPTCLEPFQRPQMHLFNGKMTVVVAENGTPGRVTLKAEAKGLESAEITFEIE